MAPISVHFHNPTGCGVGHPWDRGGRLSHYAMHGGVSQDGPGLLHVGRPLDHLGVRLGTYRSELNGVKVYQAFETRPGPPGGRSGMGTGDLLRAVWCGWSEGAVLGYAIPAVAVCLLGPGSAEAAPGCINFLVGLMAALDARGAVV